MTTPCHSDNARLTAACDEMAYEAIVEALLLGESYLISAREAAWRGDRRLVENHLSELRLCVLTALAARKRLAVEIKN